MKCSAVRNGMVSYTEGALCVADELCVDIHLVQCGCCREALEELSDVTTLVSAQLNHPDPRNDLRNLLERLEGLEESISTERCTGRATVKRTLISLSLAGALSLLLLFGAGLGWTHSGFPYLDLADVHAGIGLPVSDSLRPWMREIGPLADLEQLEILLPPSISQGSF